MAPCCTSSGASTEVYEGGSDLDCTHLVQSFVQALANKVQDLNTYRESTVILGSLVLSTVAKQCANCQEWLSV